MKISTPMEVKRHLLLYLQKGMQSELREHGVSMLFFSTDAWNT